MTVTRGTTINVDWTLNESASTASLTCTLPSAMAAGKLLVAHVVASTSSPGLPGTGSWQWAAGSPLGTNNEVLAGLAYTTDPAAGLAFTQATAGRMTVILTVYSGENALTVVDVTPTTNNVLTQSMTLTGITTVTDGDMLVSGCGINASTITTITQPSGWSLVARNTSGTGKGGAYADLGQATQGATGDEVWTNDATAGLRQVGYLAALRPAAAAGQVASYIPCVSLRGPRSAITRGQLVANSFGGLITGGASLTPVPFADTGVGDDSGLAVTATVPIADSGVGAEALTVAAAVPLADTGVGADALTTAVSIALADSGAGAETLTLAAAVPLTDSGTGSDALIVAAAVPLAQAGTGSDALAIAAAVPLADTGTGAETLVAGIAITLADTGTAADTLAVLRAIALADSGAGADTLALTVTAGFTDGGSGTDIVSVLAQIALAESGVGSDALVAFSPDSIKNATSTAAVTALRSSTSSAGSATTSTRAVTGQRTSTPAAGSSTTSASTVGGKATSTPNVSDG